MLVDKDKEIKKIKGMAPEADFEDEEQKENDKILDGDSGANSDQEKEKTYKKEKDGLERTMSREF
jgi:hypothetical protein